MKKILPIQLVQEIGKRFPDLWRYADLMRSMNGKELPEWNGNIFLPPAVWIDIGKTIFNKKELNADDIFFIQLIAAVAAWRPAQDIVCYDPDVYQSLIEMPLDGSLPSQILVQLPAWSVYIDTPSYIELDGERWSGFFAMSGYDAKHALHILRLIYLNECFGFLIKDIPLGDWGLKKAFKFLCNQAKVAHHIVSVKLPVSEFNEYSGIRQAINLLIYLCSYGFTDEEGSISKSICYPVPQRVKTGWRLFPPDKPHIVTLGVSFGEKIRSSSHSAAINGSHNGPRPHIRRAHWHSYWIGAKKDPNRKLVPRWLPPIPVAMLEDEQI